MSARPAAHTPSRRSVLRAATTVSVGGLAVTVLAGCGGGQSGTGSAGSGGQSGSAGQAPRLDDSQKSAIAAAVKDGKVPVGKAAILADAGIIVSQPTAGQYVALTDVCPHAGGKITQISSRGFLHCPLHGSEFDPATGAVKVGPANQPLGAQKISVDGDTVKKA